MRESSAEEPSNEVDRYIFHTLSHGQKRQKEIVRLLSNTRFAEGNIRENIRNLEQEYNWAQEVEEHGIQYYYRVDIGRQPTKPKLPVDYSEIEKILKHIEIQLGIKSHNNHNAPTEEVPTLPNSLNDLLKHSQSKSELFSKNDHLNRFFRIFDRLLEFLEEAYPIKKERTPSLPYKTYNLLFTLVANQHENWRRGQAHVEFDHMVGERLDKMLDLLDDVPPEVGTPILRILAMIDIEFARRGFKKVVYSNNYPVEDLTSIAHKCYMVPNDADKLIDEMALLLSDSDNEEVKTKVKEVLQSAKYYERSK